MSSSPPSTRTVDVSLSTKAPTIVNGSSNSVELEICIDSSLLQPLNASELTLESCVAWRISTLVTLVSPWNASAPMVAREVAAVKSTVPTLVHSLKAFGAIVVTEASIATT